MIRSVRGLVLRRKSEELDIRFDLLTEEGNLVSLREHGILNSKSRSRLLSEPASIVAIEYYEKGNDRGSVKEGNVVDRFDILKESWKGHLLLAHLMELALLSSRGEPSSELFDLVKAALERLKDSLSRKKASLDDTFFSLSFLVFFKIRLLGFLGIMGDPAHCAQCGEPLKGKVFWKIPDMSFLCENCSDEAIAAFFHFVRLIQAAIGAKFEEFCEASRKSQAVTLSSLNQNLDVVLEHYFQKGLNSAREIASSFNFG